MLQRIAAINWLMNSCILHSRPYNLNPIRKDIQLQNGARTHFSGVPSTCATGLLRRPLPAVYLFSCVLHAPASVGRRLYGARWWYATSMWLVRWHWPA